VSRTAGQWQELAWRENGDAAAVLLWDESSNQVRVALSDESCCHYVDFEVRLAARLELLSSVKSGVGDGEEA
jgi:hypothetical protein